MIIGGMSLCKVCLLLRRYSGSRGPNFLCQTDGWILGLISQQVVETMMSCLRHADTDTPGTPGKGEWSVGGQI